MVDTSKFRESENFEDRTKQDILGEILDTPSRIFNWLMPRGNPDWSHRLGEKIGKAGEEGHHLPMSAHALDFFSNREPMRDSSQLDPFAREMSERLGGKGTMEAKPADVPTSIAPPAGLSQFVPSIASPALDTAAPLAMDALAHRLPSPKLRGLPGLALGAVSLTQQASSGSFDRSALLGMGLSAGAMVGARFVPGLGQALLAYDVADLASQALLGKSLSKTAIGKPISNAVGKLGDVSIDAMSTTLEFVGWSSGAKYLTDTFGSGPAKDQGAPTEGFAMDEGSSFKQELSKSGLINSRSASTSRTQVGFLTDIEIDPAAAAKGTLDDVIGAARKANESGSEYLPAPISPRQMNRSALELGD
ncbi:hypothetical protein [Microvirga tunisiensis]|uniref:Uncharacterized protein n=1 Tax=Microvirga tunisiensis TaxID=2108360 RepID=A0A5N7MAB2_9HYPH|nr:hypothetical protein [Microvirga tunisiensis]MPR05661.1 hypothetical protein [Microvirga tunisiensis]MPR23861.1 hypothetical protein [Microvirga tunisiensis]